MSLLTHLDIAFFVITEVAIASAYVAIPVLSTTYLVARAIEYVSTLNSKE